MQEMRDKLNAFLNYIAEKGAVLAFVIGLVPAVLVLYVGYVWFIEPQLAANNEKESFVIKLEANVQKGLGVQASEKEFKTEFRRVVQKFFETLPLLPNETELSSILANVQTTARRHHVVLTGLAAIKEPIKTPNANEFYEREIPAAVQGKYDDVMRFFLDVSMMNRIIIVRDYNVTSAKDAKQTGVRPQLVNVSFALLAFHAPPTAEFTKDVPADVMASFSKENGF